MNYHVKVKQYVGELTSGLSIHGSNHFYSKLAFYVNTESSFYPHDSDILTNGVPKISTCFSLGLPTFEVCNTNKSHV